MRVGIVGFGFMGRMHCRCWQQVADARVVAVCDANPDVVNVTRQGNIAGAAGEVDPAGIKIYDDLEKMLSEQALDIVSVTVPSYLHAECSIRVLEAGINVLCEKPMALNEDDCSRMIDAAAQSEKLLQIAHCVRFWPEYATAKEIVAGGRYGRVLAATFQRLGSMPDWAADNWFADQQRSGGMALDLHIHDTDFVQYLFGMPQAVSSFGSKGAAGRLMHIVTHYLYEDDRVVTAEGGWSMMPPFGFEMSFNIMLEAATVVYDSTRQPTLRICTADGQSLTPQFEKADGYLLEVRHFGAMVRGEKVEEVTTLEQSRNSVRMVQAEKRSVEQGGRVVLV